jgi:hypothetical protein
LQAPHRFQDDGKNIQKDQREQGNVDPIPIGHPALLILTDIQELPNSLAQL